MLRRLLPLLPLALCAVTACAAEPVAEDIPVESADANLDYRATNGKEFDVTGMAEVTLVDADAALEGEARAAKFEELAKVKRVVGSSPAYDRAAAIFERMSTQEAFAEFLTLPLYEEIE